MRIKTSLKAGRAEGHGGTIGWNHNQTAVRSSRAPRVKTSLRAGDGWGGPIGYNHNETLVRSNEGLRVRTNLKAGAVMNHNQTAVRSMRIRTRLKAGAIYNHNETLVRATRKLLESGELR